MSRRACQHFEELDEEVLVETAKSLSVIDGFEKHECTIITRKSTYKDHMDLEQLPPNAELEDKTLQILVLL
ncbi:hypothetical protein BGZ95_011395 [Linnemannia exigua]|uniref:Uncharacterized protein n=1 Tax=Linnemannia exigua TaxID=604196 RepID=A0AAD4D9Z0_9FUNG|nr:hypothetical protein BGZ95_011395 [Linnemannia exigua]